MQTELLYELYDCCKLAVEDRNRSRERMEELQGRAEVYAEKLDMLLTNSVRERLAEDVVSRMDNVIRSITKSTL